MNNNQFNAAPYATPYAAPGAAPYGVAAPAFFPVPAGQSGGLPGGMNIDYKRILLSLWENILVIILVALLCGGAFFGYTYFFTSPQYTSSVMVYINKSTVSISGAELVLSSGEGYVSTYTTLLSSRTTLEEIAEAAGVSYSPEQLKKMISTGSSTNSAFLTVNVTCSSPKEAELIANTIASVLPARVSDIVEGSTLRIVDYAVVPSSRSTASLTKNFTIGLAAGAIAVSAVIALLVFFRTNHAPMINSASDLSTAYPEIPLLGVIRDLSWSDRKYRHADYGYGKYSDYYSSPSARATDEEKKSKDAFSRYRSSATKIRKQEQDNAGAAPADSGHTSKNGEKEYHCQHHSHHSTEDESNNDAQA